MKATMQRW